MTCQGFRHVVVHFYHTSSESIIGLHNGSILMLTSLIYQHQQNMDGRSIKESWACLVWGACSAVETCRYSGYPWHPRWRAGVSYVDEPEFDLWRTAHCLAVIFNSDIDLCGKISFKPSTWCVYWIPCTRKHTFRHQEHLSSCIGSKSRRYYWNTLIIWRPSWIFIKFWSWTNANLFS